MTEVPKKESFFHNKDAAGAIGALGGSGIFIAWQSNIHVLFVALYTHWGLTGDTLKSASDLSTDMMIILGSGVASFILSWITKHKPEILPQENNTV